MWSGSEELWVRSALAIQKHGLEICVATKYNHSRLRELPGLYYNYGTKRLGLIKGLERKFFPQFVKDGLEQFIEKNKPDLLVISQGNNIDSLNLFEYCIKNNLRFVTITQLVSEVHFLAIHSHNLAKLQQGYLKARKNFFVSNKNLDLNNLMLGITLPNAEVIRNPCRVINDPTLNYPESDRGYSVALVGRIECFHKGYDILIDVIRQEKWRNRNIIFNIYGEGPHADVIKENIKRYNLENLCLLGHLEDLSTIWKRNHILCMPSRMEGQSLALLEAMHYGRTAIVTDVGGVRELIDDDFNGFVAATASISSLDHAMERAWQNRLLWESFGLRCHETISKHYMTPSEVHLNEKIITEFNVNKGGEKI
jgi:glycosyltransferase involved in cell wall biosynthesis